MWFPLALIFNKCLFFTNTNVLTLQIPTLVMLRSRFELLPGAFNACLIPVERNEETEKGLKGNEETEKGLKGNEETEKGMKATSSSNLILVERNEETEKGLKATSSSNSFPVERNEEIEKGLEATSSSNFDEVWLLFFIVSVCRKIESNNSRE